MYTFNYPRECLTCLCHVCGQAGCPHWNGSYKKRCNDCFFSHTYKPITICNNFYFKFYPKYRIKRVYRSPVVRYVDKTNADDVRIMLTEILKILRSSKKHEQPGADERSNFDVNCLKYRCLCLSCRLYPDTCNEHCKLCRDYPGQHPIKLCGKKMLFEKGML